jgi:energy-coupling factor transporter ATP-binding protein EcfA2
MERDGRFDVFLSYARSDSGAASELNAWLRGQGFRTFFDRRELSPGLRWVPALEEAIGWSDAVAILIGRHGIGNTQQYERELALVRQTHDDTFPVIPVLMPGCENPPTGFLQLLTWIDLSRGDHVLQQQDSLEALRGAINRRPVPPSPIRGEICPYRGLEPFREEDAAFFCGRDDAIRDLVARVQAHSFVVVVGPSGSGKSSLVFAGLLPALRKQRQTTMWDVVSFRPGASPLRALAAAFGTVPDNLGPAAFDTYLENEVAAYRTGDAGKLGRVVDDRLDKALEKPDRLLIYIDQWEELYAMAPAAEGAEVHRQHSSDVEGFIALLVKAASGQKSRSTVVLTVRADFYARVIRQTLLSTLLPRQQVNIPPMASSDLRSAIETPAKKVGLAFAPPALVDQILDDAGTEEGRLPLLQFALKETWEGREGNRLTAEAYTEVGGVSGAIQKTAERAYAALKPAQQEAARRLFLRLVRPGEGQEDTRARSAIPDDPQQRDIIDLFSNPRTRLLVTGYDTLQGSATQAGRDAHATVEVAHEALIRRWPTLRAWVDGNREKLRARSAILRAKAEWGDAGKNDEFLLPSGIKLERGRVLLDNPGDVPVDDIRDYVDVSIEKEKRRLEFLENSERRRRRFAPVILLVVGIAVASISFVFGAAFLTILTPDPSPAQWLWLLTLIGSESIAITCAFGLWSYRGLGIRRVLLAGVTIWVVNFGSSAAVIATLLSHGFTTESASILVNATVSAPSVLTAMAIFEPTFRRLFVWMPLAAIYAVPIAILGAFFGSAGGIANTLVGFIVWCLWCAAFGYQLRRANG